MGAPKCERFRFRQSGTQGALKLILEPIFEADFQPGSFGYRPKRTAQEAVQRVATAIAQYKTHVIDLDLSAYFDTVRHHLLLNKVALRVKDDDVMHLLNLILKASGWKRRRSPRRGDFALVKQHLPYRGRSNAGASEGRHRQKRIYGSGIRTVCR